MRQLPMTVRYLCGVLVFAIVGPPVGALVAWLGMGALGARSPLPFIAGSWAEGGVLALGAGMLTAIAAAGGVRSWWAPVIAALAVCATFIVASAGGDWAAMLRVAKVLMPPSIVAALVCWLLTRRLFRG